MWLALTILAVLIPPILYLTILRLHRKNQERIIGREPSDTLDFGSFEDLQSNEGKQSEKEHSKETGS